MVGGGCVGSRLSVFVVACFFLLEFLFLFCMCFVYNWGMGVSFGPKKERERGFHITTPKNPISADIWGGPFFFFFRV